MSIPFGSPVGGGLRYATPNTAAISNAGALSAPGINANSYPINPNEGNYSPPVRGTGTPFQNNPSISRPNSSPSVTYQPPTPASEMRSAAIPTTASPVMETPNIPTPRPVGLASQLTRNAATGIAGTALTMGGTAAGSYLANTVTDGNNAGSGASIGGLIGGGIGSVLGASVAGIPSLGLGATAGGLGGLALGSVVGSTIGGILDNVFGKKPASVTPSRSANTTGSQPAPVTGGQNPAIGYNVIANGSIRYVDTGETLFTYDANTVIGSVSPPITKLETRADSNSVWADWDQASGSFSVLLGSTGGNFRALDRNGISLSVVRSDGQPNDLNDLGLPTNNSGQPYTPPFTPASSDPGLPWLPSVDLRGSDADRKAFPPRPTTTPAPNPTGAPKGSASPNPSPNQSQAGTGAPTATNGVDPFANGASPPFSAKPFVSGVSNPSEAYDPVDQATGLTRSQFEQRKQADVAARRARQDAPSVAAANFDAQRMEEQFKNLSSVPRNDLGGLSPQQYQRDAYTKLIEGDKIRSDAYTRAATPTPSAVSKVTVNPTGNTTPAPDLGTIAIGVTALGIATGAALTGINYIRGLNEQINTQTTPIAQQTNAKQGVCDAMQPTQCGYQGVQAATVEATNPIKDIANNNNGLLAGIGATLANMIATLATILAKFTQLFTFLDINAKVEAVKSTMTLALTVHNALMLSQSLGDTLGLIIDNVLNVFGNTFRSTDGTQISASQYLGATVRQWIINVIGADNYLKLSDALATANRIYQTGMNIVSTVQSILDSAASVAQATGINVAKIGNALRDESVVSPRAYTHMDDTALGNRPTTLSRFTALTTTISDLDTKAQNLVTITAAPIQIKDAVKQSKDDIKAFNDARDSNSVEAKAARDAKVEEIKALKPLTEATVGKRDDDT